MLTNLTSLSLSLLSLSPSLPYLPVSLSSLPPSLPPPPPPPPPPHPLVQCESSPLEPPQTKLAEQSVSFTATTPAVTKCTQRAHISRHTRGSTRGRSHSSARGRSAIGRFDVPMNSRGTTDDIPAKNLSNVPSATRVFHDRIT